MIAHRDDRGHDAFCIARHRLLLAVLILVARDLSHPGRGNARRNPLVKIAADAANDMIRLLVNFG